jgi:DNA-binding NarL/FixJ family response regulator
MAPISICILDDHPLIAEGVRRAVETTGDIICSGVATTPAEFERLLAAQPVDVALIDVRLGDASGIDLCAALRKRHPQMRILILSSLTDPVVVRRALAAGASGFAVKSIRMDMLPAAIRQVRDGCVFLSSELIGASLPLGGGDARAAELSPREREIVLMVAGGKGNKEIGRDLGLSAHTVKMHVARLLKRFNFRSRSQLATLAGTI